MQIGNKPITEWENILIDTGVILALFKSQKSTDPGVLFVRKLIDYLTKSKTGNSKDRLIYISTISLSEILLKESGEEKISRILKVIDSNNIVFTAFEIDTALSFNTRLQPYLERAGLHIKAREIGFKTNDFAMAREWISRDYMIAMSGFTEKVDVIITLDKNTFYPICNDFKTSTCILAYGELFECSEQFVIKYHYDKVSCFLSDKLSLYKTDDQVPATSKERNSDLPVNLDDVLGIDHTQKKVD